ncbi:MAG TPA: DoxX family membrane protein [Kofleriaceae bacterium]|nr:DoxX family membrane protein [Kofleriaceae bacterium]
MVPLIVLIAVFVALAVAGRVGVSPLRHWRTCLRFALAAMFLVTAWAHVGPLRGDLIRMVPPGLPAPGFLVTFTGLAELAGAIGLMIPSTARAAALWLAILLVAVFPANVHAALAGLELGGRPATPLVLRALLQVLFIAALLAVALPRRAPWRLRRAR